MHCLVCSKDSYISVGWLILLKAYVCVFINFFHINFHWFTDFNMPMHNYFSFVLPDFKIKYCISKILSYCLLNMKVTFSIKLCEFVFWWHWEKMARLPAVEMGYFRSARVSTLQYMAITIYCNRYSILHILFYTIK